MELYEEKARLRKELKKRRHNLNNDTRKEKSEQIAQTFYQIKEFKEASSVFCYLSYMDEVDTTRLVKYILKKNLKLYVPKIINNEEMVATRLRKMTDLEPDKIGILTPKTGEILLESIDIAITPGLGFTKRCERLGYGRGYYDRWFSKNHVKIKIGVAFETQLVSSLPLEKTDIAMDILITEKKVIKKK